MRRVIDPNTRFLGLDLMSEIDTYPIELSDHCLNLVRSQTVLSDFKFLTAAQTLTLVRSHGRPPQTVSLRGIGHLDTGSSAKFGPNTSRWRPFVERRRDLLAASGLLSRP
jgi:hypothetical protein